MDIPTKASGGEGDLSYFSGIWATKGLFTLLRSFLKQKSGSGVSQIQNVVSRYTVRKVDMMLEETTEICHMLCKITV